MLRSPRSRATWAFQFARHRSGAALKVDPMPEGVGAVVTSSLSSLDDSSWRQIHAAFLEHGVLVFPEQHGLSDEEQTDFARRFGAIEGQDGIDFRALRLGNIRPDGTLLKSSEGQQHEPPQYTRGPSSAFEEREEYAVNVNLVNGAWHVDSTYMPLASKVAMLYAEVVPSEGGGTGFTDMRAAWAALDSETQWRLEGLTAYHSLQNSMAKNLAYYPREGISYGIHGDAYLRPLKKIHPETGVPSLYVASHCFGVSGMSAEESDAFLTELLAFACQPPRTYFHTYKEGDLVVWDNRCMLHAAQDYDIKKDPRRLRGTRIQGEPDTEAALHAPESRDALAMELKRLQSLQAVQVGSTG